MSKSLKKIKKGIAFLLSPFFLSSFNNSSDNLILIDEIVCSKISEADVSVVFLSDSWLKNPIGTRTTIEEKIINMLWLCHGKEHGIKMLSDGSYHEFAEEHFQKLQDERGLTRDQIIDICKKSGFSIEDLKKELNEKNLVNQIIQTTISIRSLFNVTPQEIDDFFFQNPEYIETEYCIQKGSYKGLVSDFSKKQNLLIDWQKPYYIKKSNLSKSFSMIDKIENNEIITIIQNNDEVEIYKLLSVIPKKLIPIEERFETISFILQNKKFKEAYKKITKELIEDDSVNFKNKYYKDLCLNYIEKL